MMKKRLIKKRVKAMTDNELCECVAYSHGYWSIYAEREFDKRIMNEWFTIKTGGNQ